jgi:hypothetical protein
LVFEPERGTSYHRGAYTSLIEGRLDLCDSDGIRNHYTHKYHPLFPEFILQCTLSCHLSLLISLTHQDPLTLPLPLGTDIHNDPTSFNLIIRIPAPIDLSESQTLDAFRYRLSQLPTMLADPACEYKSIDVTI